MKRKTNGNPKRVADAAGAQFEVSAFCYRYGLTLQVLNDSQHWIVSSMNGKLRVEWWPSTASAVRGTADDRFKRKLRVATTDQFIELVEQELEARMPNSRQAEQPTQTAMPTDWNTGRVETVAAGEPAWPSQQVTIDAAEYARLLQFQSRSNRIRSFLVDALVVVAIVSLGVAMLSLGAGYVRLMELRRP